MADRRALLDSGTRNRLIHIPLRTKTVRAIEIVGQTSADVFRHLGEGKRFSFLPAAAAEGAASDVPATGESSPAQDAAPDVKSRNKGSPQPRQSDTAVQTRLSSEALQKRLLDIWYDARTLEEEQGVNILFVAFGLLKWFEDDKSDVERFAPLVLLPVRLERSSAADRFHLSWRTEPPSPNVSLQAKMNDEFGLKIEDFGDEDDVDIVAYMAGIAETVSRKARWAVQPDAMVLGFFSFSKFLMYRDLDPENWPDDGGLDRHPLIRSLLQDGFESSDPIISDDGNIDGVIEPAAMHHVVDADSSQAVAIEEVTRGRHLVIKGPPGTGKSQTITNIIAAAAAQGRTVLFVAEKMAALDVVHRRLRDVGLASLALELHSSKANKRVLLEELKRARGASAPTPRGEPTLVQRLTDSRDKLNRHAEMMHAAHAPSGLTPFQLLGNLIRTSGGEPARSLQAPETWSPLDLESRRDLVEEISERIAADGPPHLHPWRGVGRDALDPTEMDALRRSLETLAGDVTRMIAGAERACAIFDLPRPQTLGETARLLALVDAAAAMPDCDREAFLHPIWDRADDVTEIVRKGERFSQLRTAFGAAFVEAAWNAELGECRTVVAENGRSLFRIFSSRYRAQVSLLDSYLRVEKPKTMEQRLRLIDGLIAAQTARRAFEELEASGRAAFGSAWRKDQSDWARLGKLTSWWAAFPKTDIQDIRGRLARVTLSTDQRTSLAAFGDDVRAAQSGIDRLFAFLQLDATRIPLATGDDLRSPASSTPCPSGAHRSNGSPAGSHSWIAFVWRRRTAWVLWPKACWTARWREPRWLRPSTAPTSKPCAPRSSLRIPRSDVSTAKSMTGWSRASANSISNACSRRGTRSPMRTPRECREPMAASVRSVSSTARWPRSAIICRFVSCWNVPAR